MSRGHHPDSPSSLQNSAACPHFTNRQNDSEASRLGTKMHAAAETRDLSQLDEPEQVEAVERCLKLEDSWIARLKALGARVEVIREQYLAVCPEQEVEEWSGITGGYPDTLILAHFPDGQALAVILDWKMGKMLVTPTKDNLQGKAYALATLQRWTQVVEVCVTFYHPNVELPDPLPEYTHTFHRSVMEQLELEIRLTIARKRKAKSEGWGSSIAPCPSTNLCLWCANLGECPAVMQLANVASSKYDKLVVPSEVRPAYLERPEDMRQVLQLAGVMEAFAKAVRFRVRDMVLTEGIEVPGMKLVTKRDREVVSVAAVRDAALAHGITHEQFEACLSVPLTKLEEVIKDAAPPRKGAPAVRAFNATLEDYGAVRPGKPYSYLVADKEVPAIDV